MKPPNIFQPRLLILLPLLFGLGSCTRADVVPDLPSLRLQIDKTTPEVVGALTGSGEARSYLTRLHPGSLYYLATSLAARGQWADARVLFYEQIAQPSPVWKLPAFRGWLDCLVGLKDWSTILDQAPALLESIKTVMDGPSADQGLAGEWQLTGETVRQARLSAATQLKKAGVFRETAHEATVWFGAQAQSPLGIGESALPAWLLYQVALNFWREIDAPLSQNSPEFQKQVLPYLLGVEAREGHGDLEWHLAGGDQADSKLPPPLDDDLKLAQILARAKNLLARNQVVEAWEIYRGFAAWPGASKVELDEVRQTQATIVRLHRQAGLTPLFLVRDLYNAARLAGRISDGIVALDSLQAIFLVAEPGWRQSPLPAYLLELKGRLASARDDLPQARAYFEDGLKLAKGLEAAGLLARPDRQRLQWYLLDNLFDAIDDQVGPLFNLDRSLDIARQTDDSEYFNDVFEAAILKMGARGDWAALARWDAEMGDKMLPLLRHRCALLLARSAQLANKGSLDRNTRFQTMTARLLDQKESLYYREIGLWMRGEPVNLDQLLPSLVPPTRYAGTNSKPLAGSPLNWAETMAEGYCTMAMWDHGMEFAWDHRTEIGLGIFADLGRQFVEAGRYRQGLRLLDSARVRGGHPPDRDLLAAFYPRPFATAMAAATTNSTVAEWLMYAMVRTESSFDTGAQSGPGARGLSQLMPATARDVAKGLKLDTADLDDPATNLRLGAVYLANQWRAQRQWPQALAAYNAGAGRVRTWGRAGLSMDPIIFSEVIPYPETRNYVRRIVEGATIYAWLYYGLDASSVLSILYTPAAVYRQ